MSWKACRRLKWHLKQLDKMYSNEDSFYSKKRIESGVAFIVLQWGMVHWFIKNVDKISSSDLAMWAAIQCAICGYTLNQIQKEKREEKPGEPEGK